MSSQARISAQSQLEDLFNSLDVNDTNKNKINELKDCFDEDHVEVFLEKLESIDDLDALMQTTDDTSIDPSDQFIDFVSELIISNNG